MVIKLGTHNDRCHIDDVMAIGLLQHYFGKHKCTVKRTREPADFKEIDILVDVGGVNNFEEGRFDHHMKFFDEHFSEETKITKLSSIGLVWKYFGKHILKAAFDDDRINKELEVLPHSNPHLDISTKVSKINNLLNETDSLNVEELKNAINDCHDEIKTAYINAFGAFDNTTFESMQKMKSLFSDEENEDSMVKCEDKEKLVQFTKIFCEACADLVADYNSAIDNLHFIVYRRMLELIDLQDNGIRTCECLSSSRRCLVYTNPQMIYLCNRNEKIKCVTEKQFVELALEFGERIYDNLKFLSSNYFEMKDYFSKKEENLISIGNKILVVDLTDNKWIDYTLFELFSKNKNVVGAISDRKVLTPYESLYNIHFNVIAKGNGGWIDEILNQNVVKGKSVKHVIEGLEYLLKISEPNEALGIPALIDAVDAVALNTI